MVATYHSYESFTFCFFGYIITFSATSGSHPYPQLLTIVWYPSWPSSGDDSKRVLTAGLNTALPPSPLLPPPEWGPTWKKTTQKKTISENARQACGTSTTTLKSKIVGGKTLELELSVKKILLSKSKLIELPFVPSIKLFEEPDIACLNYGCLQHGLGGDSPRLGQGSSQKYKHGLSVNSIFDANQKVAFDFRNHGVSDEIVLAESKKGKRPPSGVSAV